MKTRNLIITLGAVAFAAITINATASDALLSPRAAGNQIKHVSNSVDTPTITVAYVDSGSAQLSPRAAGNQIKVRQRHEQRRESRTHLRQKHDGQSEGSSKPASNQEPWRVAEP